ncbi:tetratricopeptide repeat protein [Sneathiella marina]|uniref:Tetratricopeptide repeat protein n=1 Tax=Sneathiella marina TaxID=2950108 RepID=A0ABY4W7S4_9PROT|nr:tetratricopeptide repeat protein [Sneathiella marina]USG62949.1 tetratricopeptide repeat protein [Sneathiella marina]
MADPAVVEQKPIASTTKANNPEEALSWKQLVKIADKAWANNDASTAIRLYATAAKEQPKNPEPLLKIANILRKTGRTDDAINVYERIFEFDPYNIAAYHGVGYTNLQQEKPLQATKAFASALTIDGNNASSLGGMGIAYDKAGDHEKAQDYYKRAIKADPINLNYKSNLALSLALSGQTEKAIAILKVVTEDPAATPKHRQTLALAYGMAGKSKEAMKYSRMDLSEKDARNNALYFEALNGTTDVQTASIGEQVKLMKASQDKAVPEIEAVKSKPREPANPDMIVARHESETLNNNLGSSTKKKATAPKALVPAPKAPITIARVEKPAKPAKPAPTVKSTVPTPVAPKMVAQAEKPATTPKPAAPKKLAKVEKPKSSNVADAQTNSDPKPTTFAKKSPTKKSASEMFNVEPKSETPKYSEWRIEEKMTPMPAPKAEKSVADNDLPAKENIAFAAGSAGSINSYKPDGGKYYLQLGSYKERAHAEKGWKILHDQNKDILEGIDPIIAQADLGNENGGVFYRVQIGGFSNKTQTMTLCGTLRDRSHDCFMPMGANIAKPKALAPDQIMVENKSKEDATKSIAQDNKAKTDENQVADFTKDIGAL